MRVSVAIDLALDRLFDYEVPEALQKKLAIGQLLSVPFGHREARGFAMAIADARRDAQGEDVRRETGDARGEDVRRETGDAQGLKSKVSSPRFKLKPVTAIVDETPFFSPALLALVRKVAGYTASPIEAVLRTALPAAVLKKNARAKELLYVDCSIGGLGDCSIEERRLTTRQKWLVENIARLGGGWMQQLCRELKTTPASLRLLAERGLVTIEARAKRRDPLAGRRILPTKPLPLNAEQQRALEAIEGARAREDVRRKTLDERPGEDLRRETLDTSHVSRLTSFPSSYVSRLTSSPAPSPVPSRPILLFGVTGSGKTEVYLQAIAAELAAGRGAIVMVPEIALTPQTVGRFASRFGDRVAVLHSALSDGERYDEWHRIRSGAARVVVGPRSAVWAPVRDLGLIVVDEEHETSYKQDEMPRYHARDVAVLRGAVEGAKVVLGSATPSLESWMNVKRGKYALAEMTCRAGAGKLPSIRLEDMRRETGDGGMIYSPGLLDAIRLRLERHEQTILFLNRRGYSRSAVCAGCGHVMTCPDCGVPYTYHQADSCLRCHFCGGWIPVSEKCPACNCPGFDFRGIGTQRAEAALAKCFPRAKILRMDADSTSRKNSHDDILSAFRRGEADVLLGTQMIAKGLDFPNVTLVGILNADAAINMPDFRAAERAYQLFAQVAGRAGRAELPGEVIIQTYDAESPLLAAVMRGDFAAFSKAELAARQECFLPPCCHLAAITFSSPDLKLVGDWATMYAKSLQSFAAKSNNQAIQTIKQSNNFLVSDASPCALEKAEGRYRWQIVLRAPSAAPMVKAWRWISSVRPVPRSIRASLDIDAFDLI